MKNQKGFSLVELLIVVAIIGIIAAIAIPSLLAARRASNESAAIGSLRTIGSAEATYLSQTGSSGTFANLSSKQMLDSNWTSGVIRSNYKFTEGTITPTTGVFAFTAEPTSDANGQKAFRLTEDQVIRYASGLTAPASGSGTAIGAN